MRRPNLKVIKPFDTAEMHYPQDDYRCSPAVAALFGMVFGMVTAFLILMLAFIISRYQYGY